MLKVEVVHAARPAIDLAGGVKVCAVPYGCERYRLFGRVVFALLRAFSFLLADADALLKGLKAGVLRVRYILLYLDTVL